MSFGGMPDNGFTIKSIGRCRLVFGPVPASDFSMLAHGFSKKAILATDIADRIGASFVIGEPEDIQELRKLDLPVSEQRHQESLAALQLGLPKVASWLRDGDRGASSNALCKRLFGVPAKAGTAHPKDPADLSRCLRFLDATQAHDRLPMMRDVSREWLRLVNEWERLVTIFDEEKLAGPSAPRTFALMREILA